MNDYSRKGRRGWKHETEGLSKTHTTSPATEALGKPMRTRGCLCASGLLSGFRIAVVASGDVSGLCWTAPGLCESNRGGSVTRPVGRARRCVSIPVS